MVIDTLEAAFPWGVMVIEDESTSDPAPSWGSPEDLVTQALGIIVMRVRHAQEGSVVIHLCRGAGDLAGEPTYDGVIDVPSGVLSIGDAARETRMRADLPPGPNRLRIIIEPATEAAHVDITLPGDPQSRRRPGVGRRAADQAGSARVRARAGD